MSDGDGDFEVYEKELEETLAAGRALVDSPKREAAALAGAHTHLERARRLLRCLKVEARAAGAPSVSLPSSASDRGSLPARIKQQERALLQLAADIDFAGKAASQPGLPREDVASIFDKADQIQREDADILRSLEEKLCETEQLGTSTAAAMEEQIGELGEIRGLVGELRANLPLAGKQLRTFTRRIATDKLLMVLAAVFLVVVIGVVIYIGVAKGRVVREVLFSSGNAGPSASSGF